MMASFEKKKQRVIREDVKDRHTSHWDLDYVSREELEKMMTNRNVGDEGVSEQSEDNSRASTGHRPGKSTGKTNSKTKIPAPKNRDQ